MAKRCCFRNPAHRRNSTEATRYEGRSYPGFNLFRTDDLNLFQAIVRGEFTIDGLRNRDLQICLNETAGEVSRLLKGLRLHGLIKKIGRTYKDDLTRFGQAVVACTVCLRQTIVLPALVETAYQPIEEVVSGRPNVAPPLVGCAIG